MARRSTGSGLGERARLRSVMLDLMERGDYVRLWRYRVAPEHRETKAAFDAYQEAFGAEYERLNAELERLTLEEEFLGAGNGVG